jgi:hypothetical protein
MGDVVYASDDVVRAFEESTGDRLRIVSGRAIYPTRILNFGFRHRSDGPLELGWRPPRELREKYGEFSIFVFGEGKTWLKDDRLSDARPDARGTYWEVHYGTERDRRAGERYWTAAKPYGANVLLEWTPESGRKETTEQWERLIAALRRLENLE